jgi:hypothetical protein
MRSVGPGPSLVLHGFPRGFAEIVADALSVTMVKVLETP